MADLLLVYITCESLQQAQTIGKHLLDKRLCACINIIPQIETAYFWPAKSGKLEEGQEAVLIAKTLEYKYQELEDEIYKIHSYTVPCVIALPAQHVSQKYYEWIKGELD